MSTERQSAIDAITAFATEQDLPIDQGTRAGEYVVALPGENKLRTPCSLLVGERDVSISAFVIRRPDENAVEVYRFLLQRNLRTPGLAYAIDRSGDVYVTGRVPLRAVDADYLDHLFGVLLQSTDGAFNELLVLGFLQSMKREWQWRISRRESLRNLEPFRGILQDDADDEIAPYVLDEEFVRLEEGDQITTIADEPASDDVDVDVAAEGGPPGEDVDPPGDDRAQNGRVHPVEEFAKDRREGDDPAAAGS